MDDNLPGIRGLLFGLKAIPQEAPGVVIPVPLEATVTHKEGTAQAPYAIIDVSYQVELHSWLFPEVELWRHPPGLLPACQDIVEGNARTRDAMRRLIEKAERGEPLSESLVHTIDQAMKTMLEALSEMIRVWLPKQWFGLIGGEHTLTWSAWQALSTVYPDTTLLILDAHTDVRARYLGLQYSHATVFRRLLEARIPPAALIFVGTRAVSPEEYAYLKAHPHCRVESALSIHQAIYRGNFYNWLDKLIADIPTKQVYLSIDLDVFELGVVTGTGTPVPGGIPYSAVQELLRALVRQGKRIVGFDLCEGGASGTDPDLAAYLLFDLCCACVASRTTPEQRQREADSSSSFPAVAP